MSLYLYTYGVGIVLEGKYEKLEIKLNEACIADRLNVILDYVALYIVDQCLMMMIVQLF